MIITEFYTTRPDGVKLYKTYSDADLRIKCVQTNQIYDSAIDVENRGYTYIETNEHIEPPYEDPQEALQAVHVLLGN